MSDSASNRTSRQIRSTVRSDGQLELRLVDVAIPPPGADEVVVRVEATPINPSDLGLLLGPADTSQAVRSGSADDPVVTAPIPEALLPGLAARLDQPMAVGNEGAGLVVEAGEGEAAQALLGQTVAVLGREMYGELRVVRANQCLQLHPGTTAREAASCFVNPLTALGFVETMQLEGHSALVHSAAASNLGQMLQKICTADDVPLVNIVRRPEHVTLLRDLGATHVVDSSQPTFRSDLTQAIADTGATLAFDAIGGGPLAGQILSAMEAALTAGDADFSRYGSPTHKQVYIYGSLDTGPTELRRNYGMAWGLGGWLLTPFLPRIGAEAAGRLRRRVADELTTTFVSPYAGELSLVEALDPEMIMTYNRRATGEKYLINPSR